MKDEIDREAVDRMEDRINNIMGSYDIDNLVIRTNGRANEHFHDFESRYNSEHKSKVIIQ